VQFEKYQYNCRGADRRSQMDSNDSSKRNFAKRKTVNLAGTRGWMINRIIMPGRTKARSPECIFKHCKIKPVPSRT
jgi:hypothetical protein